MSDYQQYQTDLDALNQNRSKKTTRANLPLLNDDQIKNLLAKYTKPAEKQTKVADSNEYSNYTELKLSANMDGIRARVCTSRQNYFKVSVENLEVSVLNKGNEQNLGFVLNSISVQDLEPHVTYANIVSLMENTSNLINVQLTLVNTPRTSLSSSSLLAAQYQSEKFYFRNYLNENHFDLTVNANISKLRLMFLYKHLNTVLVSV